MKRYGIFGGTFDPPHIAHAIMADDVREQMHLEKIIFIPSGNPPLKNDRTDAKHRYEMAKLAFADDVNFEVSDIEMSSEGKSYTIDTLLKLREKYINDFVKFYFIIGVDALIDFPKWKTPDKIFMLSEVVVMNRPEFTVHDVAPEFSTRVKYLSVPMLEISSSLIRDYAEHGKSIKYLVHPKVEKYIKENGLYKPNK